MRALLVVLCLLIGTVCSTSAGSPDIAWTALFGGIGWEWSEDVIETSDHGYVIVAWTRSTTHGDCDIRIVKYTSDGDVSWDKTYGTEEYDDVIGGLRELDDGSLLLGGYATGPFGWESANFYMMKLDAAGNKLVDYDFDCDSATDYGHDICQLTGGNYMMVGYSYYYSEPQSQYDWGPTIMVVNPAGVLQNAQILEIPYIQELNRVVPTDDGGAIAIGRAGGSIYIMKIDAGGNRTWSKGYGSGGDGWGIVPLEDGGYMAFGDRNFGGTYEQDFWMLRLNSSGDSLWTRRYMHGAPDDGYGFDQTSDGGYVMVGEQYRNEGMDPTDIYIIRTNANGDTLWTKTIGGDGDEYAYGIRQSSDGGYIIAGRTNSWGAGEYDAYVVKLNPDNPTDVPDGDNGRPETFSLSANYPNPFNPSTTIEYSLERRGHVRLEIFNPLGQHVRTLLDDERPAGSYHVVWDGLDDNAHAVATGIYFYRMTIEGVSQAKKMLLLK